MSTDPFLLYADFAAVKAALGLEPGIDEASFVERIARFPGDYEVVATADGRVELRRLDLAPPEPVADDEPEHEPASNDDAAALAALLARRHRADVDTTERPRPRRARQSGGDARYTSTELAAMTTLAVDPVKGEQKTGGSRVVWYTPATHGTIVEVLTAAGTWKTAETYTAE